MSDAAPVPVPVWRASSAPDTVHAVRRVAPPPDPQARIVVGADGKLRTNIPPPLPV